jgi:hypothetical protein
VLQQRRSLFGSQRRMLVTITEAARFIAWLAGQGIDSRALDGDELRSRYRVYQRRLQDATARRYEREWQRTEWARDANVVQWQSQERATAGARSEVP